MKATASPNHPKTSWNPQQNQTKILKVFCVAIQYYVLLGFFCKLTWVTTTSYYSVWEYQCFHCPDTFKTEGLKSGCESASAWDLISGFSACFLSPFLFFPVPTTRVEGTTCLMILSLEDGKEGYSRLSFVILYHPFWICSHLHECCLHILGELRHSMQLEEWKANILVSLPTALWNFHKNQRLIQHFFGKMWL